MQYDVIIIGAGPGGIFSAYELSKLCPDKKIAVFEEGQPLEKRRCPIDGKTVKHCIGCPTCAIMNGFDGLRPSVRLTMAQASARVILLSGLNEPSE